MRECTCDVCLAACKHKPGWFLPGEPEKAADALGMTLREFFDQHLAVDYYTAEDDIFLLAPAILGCEGDLYPADPRGYCAFLKDDRCSIYSNRPHECREYIHGEEKSDIDARHALTAEAWNTHPLQLMVRKLLGREPEAESWSPSIFEALGTGGW